MAGILETLEAEVTTDPLGRGYSGMTDEQVVVSLNAVDRDVIKPSLSGDEIFNAADGAELAALAKGTTAQKAEFQMFLSICARDSIDPQGNATTRLIREIFGAGSTTLTNLGTLRTQTVSRAVELGLGQDSIGAADVARARS